MAGRVLVTWPGIEPVASAVDAQSLHHWTNREVLVGSHFPEFPSICKETLNRGQHVNLQPSAIPPTKLVSLPSLMPGRSFSKEKNK